MFLKNQLVIILLMMGGLFALGYLLTDLMLFFAGFILCQLVLVANCMPTHWFKGSSDDGEVSTGLDHNKSLENDAGEMIKNGAVDHDTMPLDEAKALTDMSDAEVSSIESEDGKIIYSNDELLVKDLQEILENISRRMSGSLEQETAAKFELSDDLQQLFREMAKSQQKAEPVDIEYYTTEVDDIIQAYVTLILQLRQQSSEAADRIQKMTRQIDTIFSVVDNVKYIADKTSLVALNAAIEAARSGQVGRSYAFVAKEVQKLSSHSEKFGKEIQKEMERAKKSVSATSEIIDTIAVSDVEVAIATKTFIDQSLGRLRETIYWFQEPDNVVPSADNKVILHERMKAIIGDIQRLLAVVHLKLTLLDKVDIFSENGRNSLTKLGGKVSRILHTSVVIKK